MRPSAHKTINEPAMSYCYEYPRPAVTVDLVIFTIADFKRDYEVKPELQVLLIKRGGSPHKGKLALPGGFVNMDESLEQAAARELKEETGVEGLGELVQLGSYSDPNRDTRGRVITTAFMTLCSRREVIAGSDAAAAGWHLVFPATLHPGVVLGDPCLFAADYMAFDHAKILRDAVKRLQRDFNEYGPRYLAGAGNRRFTLKQLQDTYEAVFAQKMDVRNFRRRMMPILAPIKGSRIINGGRPAQLFEVKQ